MLICLMKGEKVCYHIKTRVLLIERFLYHEQLSVLYDLYYLEDWKSFPPKMQVFSNNTRMDISIVFKNIVKSWTP